MASKKKRDLEIVYNLQWKTRCNGDDKQANIIGVYDVPQTTLDWETFKSYLLKNSGTTGDDVKVSYMSEEGEVPVNSQRDFQIALYTFRKKARNGEVITLWLDRISDKKQKMFLCIDAETQANGQENKSSETVQMMENGPPEWFRKYMKQFRRELLEDVKGVVMPLLSQREKPEHSRLHATTFTTDWKPYSKRSRQEKELMKNIKLQSKLENKLEKIELKAQKIKEKNLVVAAAAAAAAALRSNKTERKPLELQDKKPVLSATTTSARQKESDDVCKSNTSKSCSIGIKQEELEMYYDGKPVRDVLHIVPHMVGGETYLQQWEVVNTGNVVWDSETELRLAWGHELLIPMTESVPLPHLKPGEKGIVSVVFNVPSTPGEYESYWYFLHKGRRFGHWLGCNILVDPLSGSNSSVVDSTNPLKCSFTTSSLLPTVKVEFPNPFEDHFAAEEKIERKSPKPLNTDEVTEDMKNLSLDGAEDNKEEIATGSQDDNCSSDSDNQSIISIADTNTSVCSGSSDEFVVISAGEKSQNEEDKVEVSDVGNADDNNNNAGGATDLSKLSTVIKTEGSKSGYAYITINEKKIAVPKCFLHDEYLATAEDAPDPTEPQTETSTAAIPQSTVESTVPLKSEETNPIFTKSTTEPCPTYSEDFGKLTQSSAVSDAQAAAISLHNSHCSAAGSNFSDVTNSDKQNDRIFVFPAGVAGFEVISTTKDDMAASLLKKKEEKIEDQGIGQSLTNLEPPEPYISNHEVWQSFSNLAASAPLESRMLGDWTNSGIGDYTYPAPNFHPPPYIPYPIPPNMHVSAPMSVRVPPHSVHLPQPIQPIISHTKEKQPSTSKPTANVKSSQPPLVQSQQPHLLRENLMTGAVNVASSAINTAKSVLQMIAPVKPEEPGKWVNGHWVSTKSESPCDLALNILAEMGFTDRDYNATLLNRYDYDLDRVIADLLTST